MEITLLVSPTGSITFHCDEPFTHIHITLEEIEETIQKLIAQKAKEEAAEEASDRLTY